MYAPSAVNEQAWHFVVMCGKILDDILLINGKRPKSAPVSIRICQDLPAERQRDVPRRIVMPGHRIYCSQFMQKG
jgi:nitroreductase